MTYEEFIEFVESKCLYETIYEDSEGRTILVIRILDAYGMVNKAKQGWVGLTDEEVDDAAHYCVKSGQSVNTAIRTIEQALKENTHEHKTGTNEA